MNQLAIVIPFYKIDFFEETLKSIASQTNQNFTLYIGNDASANDPLPTIQKYLKTERYHYYNYTNNLGGENLALQWERILENVTEEWFQILGDDDMISANFVEEFYINMTFADHLSSNVIKFSQCFINESGEKTNNYTLFDKTISPEDVWRSKHFFQNRSSLSEHIFRTSAFRRHLFRKFPLAWYSDDIAVLEFSERKEIIFIKNAKVYIRMSSVNISSKTDNAKEKEKAKIQYLELILSRYLFLFTKDQLIKEFDDYLHLCWKNKITANLHFTPIYLKTRPWYKLVNIPYKKYLLYKNAALPRTAI